MRRGAIERVNRLEERICTPARQAVPAEGRSGIEAAVHCGEKQGVRRACIPPPVAGLVTSGFKRRKAQGTEDPRQAVRRPPRHARVNRSRRSLGEGRKLSSVPVTRKQGITSVPGRRPGSADFPPPTVETARTLRHAPPLRGKVARVSEPDGGCRRDAGRVTPRPRRATTADGRVQRPHPASFAHLPPRGGRTDRRS